MDFCLGAEWLGVELLYPLQALLLKIIFCSPQLLTTYDLGVLDEWKAGFSLHSDPNGQTGYRGVEGVGPDVLERIDLCLSEGRRWFRQVVAVIGRRGGKGYVGALAGAYTVWELLATYDDPAARIAKHKQLHVFVFADQHDQARVNQWRDLADRIEAAPCFGPYIASRGSDTLRLYSPAQVETGIRDPDKAAIVIGAKQSTGLGGRGPASPIQLYDEMAHMVAAGTNRSAEEIFDAAVPAASQFREKVFLYQASSPWQQQGAFYRNYQRGLAVDAATQAPLDHDILVVQLPSWAMYRDWDRTGPDGVEAFPGGPTFPEADGPIYDYDDTARREERSNPDRYAVEHRALWASSVAAYLPPDDIAAVFAPWDGQVLCAQMHGTLNPPPSGWSHQRGKRHRRRMSGWGQARWALAWATSPSSIGPPIYVAAHCVRPRVARRSRPWSPPGRWRHAR